MGRMASNTGPRAYAVYLAIRSVLALLQVLPIDWALRLAKLLAKGWPLITRRHLDRAIKHLNESFPNGEYNAAKIERIARRSLEHWTMFAFEVACAPRLLSPASWPRYITPVDFDEVLRLLLDGKGMIMVTGHYGHFEMTGYLMACLGFDVVGVMRPLDNEYLNRFVVQSRRAHGLELLVKKEVARQAEEILAAGKPLGFIADQSAGRKGLLVDFFGRPASTYKSIGLLAMAANVPIVVGYARRRGEQFHYEVGVQSIIHPHEWKNLEDPLRWITQTYTSQIEAFVRKQPDQYLWIHRRWKTQPKYNRNRG
jgi:KDO2-lipid IV(A) lauroyltransferase